MRFAANGWYLVNASFVWRDFDDGWNMHDVMLSQSWLIEMLVDPRTPQARVFSSTRLVR